MLSEVSSRPATHPNLDLVAPHVDLGPAERVTAVSGPYGIAGHPDLVLTFGTPSGRWVRKVHRAEIAQLVEHATENRGVASSNLALGTNNQAACLERKWLSW